MSAERFYCVRCGGLVSGVKASNRAMERGCSLVRAKPVHGLVPVRPTLCKPPTIAEKARFWAEHERALVTVKLEPVNVEAHELLQVLLAREAAELAERRGESPIRERIIRMRTDVRGGSL